jgi:hypothetical protein
MTNIKLKFLYTAEWKNGKLWFGKKMEESYCVHSKTSNERIKTLVHEAGTLSTTDVPQLPKI